MHAGEGKAAAAEYEVKALLLQGYEAEPEGLRGRAGGDAAIGVAASDGIGGVEVSAGEAVGSGDAGRGQGLFGEQTIEEGATAGSGFAIDEAGTAGGEVGERVDAAGVAGGGDESFFPMREGDDDQVLAGEFTAQEGQVELAGFGVAEVGSGDVYLAFAEPIEGLSAGCGSGEEFDSFVARGVRGEKAEGGVATGERNAVLGSRGEGHGLRGAGPVRARKYGVGVVEKAGSGGGGHGDGGVPDVAEAYGRALRDGCVGEEFGVDGRLGGRGCGGELEDLFHADAKFGGHAEGYRSVGNVGAAFDGVDGLSSDADAAGKVAGADATGLAKLGELVMNRLRHVYLRRNTISIFLSMRTERAPRLSFGATRRKGPSAPVSG